MSERPPSWLTRGIGFHEPEPSQPMRVHWYRRDAQRSQCGNYDRPFMAYSFGPGHPLAALCPRCLENGAPAVQQAVLQHKAEGA